MQRYRCAGSVPAETDGGQGALPVCVYLGDAVPNQKGPCGQRLCRCDEFGTATVQRCEKSPHWCHGPDGERCPEFVARD